eukprot:g4045.t1
MKEEAKVKAAPSATSERRKTAIPKSPDLRSSSSFIWKLDDMELSSTHSSPAVLQHETKVKSNQIQKDSQAIACAAAATSSEASDLKFPSMRTSSVDSDGAFVGFLSRAVTAPTRPVIETAIQHKVRQRLPGRFSILRRSRKPKPPRPPNKSSTWTAEEMGHLSQKRRKTLARNFVGTAKCRVNLWLHSCGIDISTNNYSERLRNEYIQQLRRVFNVDSPEKVDESLLEGTPLVDDAAFFDVDRPGSFLPKHSAEALCRIICVLCHMYSLSYAPLVPELLALMLGPMDDREKQDSNSDSLFTEYEAFHCISALVARSQQRQSEMEVEKMNGKISSKRNKTVQAPHIFFTRVNDDICSAMALKELIKDRCGKNISDVLYNHYHSWLTLGFSRVFCRGALLRIFDCAFSEGYKIFFRIALALIWRHHKIVKIGNNNEIESILSFENAVWADSVLDDGEKILETCFAFPNLKRSDIRKYRTLAFHSEERNSRQKAMQIALLQCTVSGSRRTKMLTSSDVYENRLSAISRNRKKKEHICRFPMSIQYLFLGKTINGENITENLQSDTLSGVRGRVKWWRLKSWLDEKWTVQEPLLLYSTSHHGWGAENLFKQSAFFKKKRIGGRANDPAPSLLMIETLDGQCFGAFLYHLLQPGAFCGGRNSMASHYMLFRLASPSSHVHKSLVVDSKAYYWAGLRGGRKNSVCAPLMIVGKDGGDSIVFGAGGGTASGEALKIDPDFHFGHCESSNAFAMNGDILCDQEKKKTFSVKSLEVFLLNCPENSIRK